MLRGSRHQPNRSRCRQSCPVTNWKWHANLPPVAGPAVPVALDEAYAAAIRDDRHDLLSTRAYASEMCSGNWWSEGVEKPALYTLNRPETDLAPVWSRPWRDGANIACPTWR